MTDMDFSPPFFTDCNCTLTQPPMLCRVAADGWMAVQASGLRCATSCQGREHREDVNMPVWTPLLVPGMFAQLSPATDVHNPLM